MFDFKYDLSRQLKFDFTSNNIARIDEPAGGVDRRRYSTEYNLWRDSVMTNLRNFGRTTNYNHYLNLTYTIPVNKLPLLSWVNANARYGSDYTWLAGPVYPDSMNINIGNSIKNRNDLSLTAMASFTTLYNKSRFLRQIESNTRPDAGQRMKREYRTVTFSRSNINFREGIPRAIIHNLRTSDVKVRVTNKDGSEVEGRLEVVSETRINFTTTGKVDGARVDIEGRVPVRRSPFIVTGEYMLRALMGLRNVSLTMTSSQGQFLPGYMPGTNYLGMSDYNDILAPGWPFILGYSDKNFFDKAASYGWLSKDTLLNSPATYNNRFDISARAQLEPFPGMRIDVNADRRFLEGVSAYYIADYYGNFPDSTRNRIVTGNFSISIISWGSTFEKISKDNDYVSPAFEKFKENLAVISSRRAAERAKTDPYYDPDHDPLTGEEISGPYKSGYGMTSGEVMIPAFIAAYTKSDPGKISLETFPSALKMMPNWRFTFDGLSRFPFVQKVFRSVNISHQYRSTYQIGSYTTNLSFITDASGAGSLRDLQSNFIQQYEIGVVTINEQFSPLINVDMNWKNSLTTRFEWRKSRTVSLNLASNQIADARINELIIGAGYRFDDVQIVLRTSGGQKSLRSDLNLRFDLSVRDNKTLARKLVEDVNQPVVGQKVFTAGLTADYVLSDRFNLQLFADHTMNNPFVANTFPTSNTNFGFSLKFTLV
jgi:cell surface protein SprA